MADSTCCAPVCEDRACGEDGCGGSCGTGEVCWEDDETCSSTTGTCEDLPDTVEVAGLIWQVHASSDEFSVDGAADHCASLDEGGLTSWRVPTIDELRLLIDGCSCTETGGACEVTDGSTSSAYTNDTCSCCYGGQGPGYEGCYWDSDAFPGTGLCDYYPYGDADFQSASTFPAQRWGIDFYFGTVKTMPTSYTYFVRCVHDP